MHRDSEREPSPTIAFFSLPALHTHLPKRSQLSSPFPPGQAIPAPTSCCSPRGPVLPWLTIVPSSLPLAAAACPPIVIHSEAIL
ncbi:MAG TPA: hypothetical protein VGN34_21285 [Ktedonobacteraceae bacterium]